MNKHNHYFFDVSKHEKVGIYRTMRTVERSGNKADMAKALYAAGYRKQEQSV